MLDRTNEIEEEGGELDADHLTTNVRRWFAAEVLPLTPMLTRFLERNWRNPSEISDLRQEVLIRAYEVAFDCIPTSPRAFLFQVARNLLVDRCRRDAVRSIVMTMDIDGLSVAADAVTPEHEMASKQEFALFHAKFASLSPRIQEAIILRRLDGLSQREAADRMGISVKAIERYMSVGLHYLATALRGTSIPTGRYQNGEKGMIDAPSCGHLSIRPDGLAAA